MCATRNTTAQAEVKTLGAKAGGKRTFWPMSCDSISRAGKGDTEHFEGECQQRSGGRKELRESLKGKDGSTGQ